MFNATSPDQVSDEKAIDFIKAYQGTFSFLLSLKSYYFKNHFLSAAQLNGVKKCVIADQKFQAKKDLPPVLNAPSYTIAQNTIIKVGRRFAKELGNQVGLDDKGHFAYKIVNVLGETAKAFRLELQATGQRSSFCSCCGRTLTDAYSVQNGIGPICAKKYGIFNAEELDTKLALTHSITTWLPKSALKLRITQGVETPDNLENDDNDGEQQSGDDLHHDGADAERNVFHMPNGEEVRN